MSIESLMPSNHLLLCCPPSPSAFNLSQHQFNSVQFSFSVMSISLWPPWTAASQASLSITISRSLVKLMSIESLMPSNHLILCHPLLHLPSVFPSIRVFSNESVLCMRWPKYWSFSFSISPSNEYSGLISFRKVQLIYNVVLVSGISKVVQLYSFQIIFLYRLLQNTEYNSPCHRIGPCWLFVLYIVFQFSSVQSLSCVWFFVTPWITARQASLSITNMVVHLC